MVAAVGYVGWGYRFIFNQIVCYNLVAAVGCVMEKERCIISFENLPYIGTSNAHDLSCVGLDVLQHYGSLIVRSRVIGTFEVEFLREF